MVDEHGSLESTLAAGTRGDGLGVVVRRSRSRATRDDAELFERGVADALDHHAGFEPLAEELDVPVMHPLPRYEQRNARWVGAHRLGRDLARRLGELDATGCAEKGLARRHYIVPDELRDGR